MLSTYADPNEEDLTPSDQALAEEFESPFIFTVSEFTKSLTSIIRSNFTSIWIKGEISDLAESALGHIYFKLKDEHALLQATVFKSQLVRNPALKANIVAGTIVECLGSLTFYEKRGSCQLLIQEIRSIGVGDLQLAFLAQREKFIKEGLFAPEHKQPLPLSATHIGIITSSTGAVISDMLNAFNKAAKHVYGTFALTLYDTPVQGSDAASGIVKQIKCAHKEGLADILVLARGGGSIEELAVFNNPAVVRAVALSTIPIISAIGHETDWVFTDEAADYRTSTPTAAAEHLLKNRARWIENILALRMVAHEQIRMKLRTLTYEIDRAAPYKLQSLLKNKINTHHHQLRLLRYACTRNLNALVQTSRNELSRLNQLLSSLAPQQILKRGYAAIEKDKTRITHAAALKKSDRITLIFQDDTHTADIR
ncbi:exodeoxyribonuclease 7 large subunit [Spirochaetota bacterium]|nr:exodeoxyribonuclease 7 large subunit [Spirochaetota bacterium]